MQWRNFDQFLDMCEGSGITKLYLTGQNTDSLLYPYIDELYDYLKKRNFSMGIRTNGYMIPYMLDTVRSLNDEIGLSIHTLNPETNKLIMDRDEILDWENLIPKIKSETNTVRVAIVINRYNKDEVIDLIKFLSQFPEIQYIQARRISTDTRYDELKEDIEAYEELYNKVVKEYGIYDTFYDAQRVRMFGKEVCWWRTVETSANSLNYFTDGTISDNYFVVEGYLNNYQTNLLSV
jgi:molybdenum cofactor biosynthesis enzyme MoaA